MKRFAALLLAPLCALHAADTPAKKPHPVLGTFLHVEWKGAGQ